MAWTPQTNSTPHECEDLQRQRDLVLEGVVRPLQRTGRDEVSHSTNGTGPQAHRVDARPSFKSREPTSAMAVSEPGLASSADGKGEKGIDRSFERTGTLMHLGQ
jgi:hypothetical protein